MDSRKGGLVVVAVILIFILAFFLRTREQISFAPPDFSQYYPGAPGYIHPAFYIEHKNRPFVRYSVQLTPSISADGNTRTYYDPGYFTAVVKYLGNDIWQIDIINLNQTNPIVAYNFPYDHYQFRLDGDNSDDLMYTTEFMGAVRKVSSLAEHTNNALFYPGHAKAPLTIVADDDQARIVAAVNYDGQGLMPKDVIAQYDLNRQKIYYSEEIPPGGSTRARALISIVSGDASTGNYPWHRAMDKYKDWLDSVMAAESLELHYPQWMKESNGWINMQFENDIMFNGNEITTYWQNYGLSSGMFNWIQIWGQMSNYADPDFAGFLPWNGTTPPQSMYDGFPPIKVGETLGCCSQNRTMHPRYLTGPSILNEVNLVKSQGGRVGYYTKPIYNWDAFQTGEGDLYLKLTDDNTYSTYDANDETPLEYLVNWQEKNFEEYGANANYYDVLAAGYFGDIMTLAKWYDDGTFVYDSVSEGAVDLYPSAFLISGVLSFGGENAYLETLENSNEITAPYVGRYLLNDRIMFLGMSNGDHQFWGANKDYWTIRQAFLLGAKFDTTNPNDGWGPNFNVPNPMMKLAIDEWERVDFWNHEPIYLHQDGIANIVGARDVSLFSTNIPGKHFVAIDNYDRSSSVSFDFYGDSKSFNIPNGNDGLPERLYMAEINEVLPASCGDSKVQFPEECDNGALNGIECDVGAPGEVCQYCSAQCTLESVTGSGPVCGNGIVESSAGEECDGSNLNGQSCSTLGFASGSLGCSMPGGGQDIEDSCVFDLSNCEPFVPSINIVSPMNDSFLVQNEINVDFNVADFVVGGIGQRHVHFNINNDPQDYMFYNGATNSVTYSGSSGIVGTRVDSNTIRFSNLSDGVYVIKANLVEGNHANLPNAEAQDSVTVSVQIGVASLCGNGKVEIPDEQCDPAGVLTTTCVAQGYPAGGTLGCFAAGNVNECTFNFAGCSVLPLYSEFNGSKTTNFASVPNIENVQNAVLENQFGMIEFSAGINFSRLNLNSAVDISSRTIRVETGPSGIPALDVLSNISFYGLSFDEPKVFKNGASCSDCQILSYSGGVLKVRVTGFSVYTVEESAGFPDDDGPQAPQDTPPPEELLCNQNWVCGAWGACVEGLQTRTCNEVNQCDPANLVRVETRECGLFVPDDETPGTDSVPRLQPLDIFLIIGFLICSAVVLGIVIYFVFIKDVGTHAEHESKVGFHSENAHRNWMESSWNSGGNQGNSGNQNVNSQERGNSGGGNEKVDEKKDSDLMWGGRLR